MAFRKKGEYILKLQPDIVVVAECEHLKCQKFRKFVIEPNDRLWIGENETKGLDAFAYLNYKLEVYDKYNSKFRYVLPIKVTVQNEFNLLAVWAINDKELQQNRYIARVWLALNYYKKLLNGKTVIIGYFNSNVIWDNDKPKKAGKHTVFL